MNFVERIKQERKELNDRIEKLSDFLDERFVENVKRLDKISSGNKILLHKQLEKMIEYRDILDIRIELNT